MAYSVDYLNHTLVAVNLQTLSSRQFVVHSGIAAVAVRNDGRYAMILYADNTLTRLDLATGVESQPLSLGKSGSLLDEVLLGHDGSTAFIAEPPNTMVLVNVDSMSVTRRYSVPAGVGQAVLSANDKTLFVANNSQGEKGNVVSIVNLVTGAATRALETSWHLRYLALSFDESVLYAVSDSGQSARLEMVFMKTGRQTASQSVFAPLACLASATDSRQVYLSGSDTGRGSSFFYGFDETTQELSSVRIQASRSGIGCVTVIPKTSGRLGIAVARGGLNEIRMQNGATVAFIQTTSSPALRLL
jgi:hypothetical protein